MIGKIHSIQTLGTVDGPGIRFVVFMQGCHLRCGCCHNPDTWNISQGMDYHSHDIAERAAKYRPYFKKIGGITVSGGEPLLQAAFVHELFTLCREQNINTCLDTSGTILSETVKALLSQTDRVLLDIKYTTEAMYREYVGGALTDVLAFLDYLDSHKIATTLRQVIIPGLNDTEENIRTLRSIADAHKCVDGIELLPFRKICQIKYDRLKIPFPFADYPTPDSKTMQYLESLLAQGR